MRFLLFWLSVALLLGLALLPGCSSSIVELHKGATTLGNTAVSATPGPSPAGATPLTSTQPTPTILTFPNSPIASPAPKVSVDPTTIETSAFASPVEPSAQASVEPVFPATGISPIVTPAPATTATSSSTPGLAPRVYAFEVVQAYPHDPGAFTQGLDLDDGVLYEGTGLRTRSSLRRVDLETGEVEQLLSLDPDLFGEGITILDGRIYQLTWQDHVGFVYDRDSFELLQTWTYAGEGWGLTHDGQRLIMSDGSDILTFLDPETLQVVDRVAVRDELQRPVMALNELEYVDGEVYANIWRTDFVARIDPDTGQVVGWIDLTGLLPPEDRTQPVDVLNGIAYDEETGRLFLTGKLWPKLFEVRLVPLE